jgi:hypothetical protein
MLLRNVMLTLNRVHGVISQKLQLFIATAVRTSDPTLHLFLNSNFSEDLIYNSVPSWPPPSLLFGAHVSALCVNTIQNALYGSLFFIVSGSHWPLIFLL